MEAVIQCLKEDGYEDIVCVENKTVVTNAYKGEKLNKYVNIFKKYRIPVLYNFRKEDMKWVKYEPKGKMLVLDKVFPGGIYIPDYFFDKNIIHLPTMKCHIYTTTTGAMKNAFGGLLDAKRHYCHSVIHKTLVDCCAYSKRFIPGYLPLLMVPLQEMAGSQDDDTCGGQLDPGRGRPGCRGCSVIKNNGL